MNGERWAVIPNYDGRYEVSDLGRVRAVQRIVRSKQGARPWIRPAQMMKTRQRKRDGYIQVGLTPAGEKQRFVLVHPAVLEAFVGSRPPGHHARHLNGIKTDNRLSNLAWGTPTENMYDTVRLGRHHGANKTHCKHNHEFTSANTFMDGRGRRQCRACCRRRDRKRRARASDRRAA